MLLSYMLCFSECLVHECVFCLLLHFYQYCVTQEEPSTIASNQQIYDFYNLIIFEKKRH